MMIVRHAELRDLDDIFILAGKSGVGLTSLPQNKEILSARIARTQKTLQGQAAPSEQGYLFVLEDTQEQRVVGVSAIEVAVGLTEPFYNFHVGKQVHASQALNVYKALDTLFLSNDLTGCSELCTLFLDPDYRKDQNGKLLSKIRFLFIAAFQQAFQNTLIAEMRGYSDEIGRSPFWDALGNHFFNMDFSTADYLSGIGQKVFIAELMPRFPVYIDLLPLAAQQVIAQLHPHTVPAARVLESEGLRYQGYVDIFDAGPTLEAEVKNLRAVKDSRICAVKIVHSQPEATGRYLVANDRYLDYRAILIQHAANADSLSLTAEQAYALGVQAGQSIRMLPLDKAEQK
ncbi:arginine N-succinyltransferase [Acinetobacter zhairhuonensis]|jgi:arginine N-succinyltransferase|uniref:arginine N-succinyltransferase n=1 Tax=Acinetobacter sp. A7.4 TaxID=2919921 RepID=UPI001F4F1BC5|nr:arginine N-succinyltransferase [Acinetobacter sp. A7.4]MCJ8161518.1 arginine N-succinyltransferase [Acinetobacter sp. A7.4]